MPVEIKVDYSPSLTDAECQMLTVIESSVAECVWILRSIPRTLWRPKQDQQARALYCLTPYNEPSNIILYYTETEIGRLNPEVIRNDIAFQRRAELPEGFSDRPQLEDDTRNV